MAHPERAAEQAYVDNAYEQLDRMRSTVARTQEAMATEWAALNMEAWAKRRMPLRLLYERDEVRRIRAGA